VQSLKFNVIETAIDGLNIIERLPILDSRGFFERFYCFNLFKNLGIDLGVTQINHSMSHKTGTLRGLHYQVPPFSEIKYVSCIRGEIFDVAVDLRKDSPTFLNWHAEVLSETNNKSLFIPEGFAHGFQSLKEDSEILYIVSNEYSKESERNINPFDIKLKIEWPLNVSDMSEKDKTSPDIAEDFQGLELK
jgi:dTDP-4-dehydrorhamnose 3,5-epimerase